MAQLNKDTQISEPELIDYLDSTSDFAFELRCLEKLTTLRFQCDHGGSYSDPVSKKTRQFDIRAYKSQGLMNVRCAVECKNLRHNFPLLIMCMPRLFKESYHEVIVSYPKEYVKQHTWQGSAFADTCKACRIRSSQSVYTDGDFVGKSCAQVGVATDGSIVARDNDVYDKWSQALASADQLAYDSGEEGPRRKNISFSLTLPMVVVPDGTLWQVNYKSDGTRQNKPVQTNRCSFFVDQQYSIGDMQNKTFTISHLEFITLTGLENLLINIFRQNNPWFARDVLDSELNMMSSPEA